jgi:hypothetical protein
MLLSKKLSSRFFHDLAGSLNTLSLCIEMDTDIPKAYESLQYKLEVFRFLMTQNPSPMGWNWIIDRLHAMYPRIQFQWEEAPAPDEHQLLLWVLTLVGESFVKKIDVMGNKSSIYIQGDAIPTFDKFWLYLKTPPSLEDIDNRHIGYVYLKKLLDEKNYELMFDQNSIFLKQKEMHSKATG